jgi:hypothetical protein
MENQEKINKRISLTKSQLTTDEGQKLLNLCVEITNDGEISQEELSNLTQLISEHTLSELPAFNYLLEAIQRSKSDKELYKAIESVLPVNDRKAARKNRTDKEHATKTLALEERKAKKALEKHQAKLDAPIMTFDFMTAGTKFENRAPIIDRYLDEDDTVYFERDLNNKFSKNAVKMITKNHIQFGFVPEFEAEEIANLLDQGYDYECYVKKIIGYNYPIPVIKGHFFRKKINHAPIEIKTQKLTFTIPMFVFIVIVMAYYLFTYIA